MLTGSVASHETQAFDRSAPPSLDKLLALYQQGLLATNNTIGDSVDSNILLIPKISHHLLDAGGKRIRSLLLLASADLATQLATQLGANTTPPSDNDAQKIIALSASVELIHTATLLHDDVVDNSTMRRGQPTANQIWDNKLPVLVGDYLFSCAFMLMVQSESLPVLQMLSATSAELAAGEVLQLQYERDPNLSEEIYYQIIHAKTASLFRSASHAGALLAGADSTLQDSLQQFGREFGVLFQLVDDIIDYQSSTDVMGKIAGDDLREGKVTLPLIYLRQRMNDAEKTWLDAMIATPEKIDDNTLGRVQKLLADYDIIAKACDKAYIHAQQLYDILQTLRDAPAQNKDRRDQIIEALKMAVDFSMTRLS